MVIPGIPDPLGSPWLEEVTQDLTAELFNTVIEKLCDLVEPDEDARIGAIRDVSSAAVGIAVRVWALALHLELGRRLRRPELD